MNDAKSFHYCMSVNISSTFCYYHSLNCLTLFFLFLATVTWAVWHVPATTRHDTSGGICLKFRGQLGGVATECLKLLHKVNGKNAMSWIASPSAVSKLLTFEH